MKFYTPYALCALCLAALLWFVPAAGQTCPLTSPLR